MSNVSNPSGPVNPLNPQKPTEPARPGTDKFKDLMKIDSSAEKQKKKKKRPEESREDSKAKLQAGPAEPDKNISSTKKAEKYPKVQKIGESEKKQTKHGKRPEETTTELAREEAAALAQKKPAQPLQISRINEEDEQEEITTKAATSSQIHKELEEIFEEEKEILQREETAENFKKVTAQKQEPKKDAALPPPAAPSTTTLGPLFLSPATSTTPAYALMNAETLALFEKMVSVITILKDSGVTETTFHLNTTEFANSQYYGAQIIIREYSTAPLTYNIEFLGNPLAAEQFQKNLSLLRTAFNDPKYRFRVNRLESSISKEPYPRVERKKESDDEE